MVFVGRDDWCFEGNDNAGQLMGTQLYGILRSLFLGKCMEGSNDLTHLLSAKTPLFLPLACNSVPMQT